MFDRLKEEINSIKARDPAVRSALEVIFLYPSFKAVRSYRRAHWFYEHGHFFIARWISQSCRNRTGIEIHPGAKIGKGLFIDHGAGVVIGETTEIGDYCTLYQNVTLGGTGKDTGKRHPTLGNNVLVGAGARVLGPMKIGDNSKIAANAVVLEEVPPNCTAVGVPARVVKRDGVRVGNSDLDQIHIPDPVSQLLCEHMYKIECLQQEIDELKKQLDSKNNNSQEENNMQIYNTMTRQKEELKPITPGTVKIYACGPTVYNLIHIGNARALCVFDTLRRYLEFRGYKVFYVQNFTDVDDKIIKKANELGKTAHEVSENAIREYFTDADGLNVRRADVHPKVTENMDIIIDIVKTLIEKGFAYEADGDVYFETSKFPEYGKLSHMPLEDLQAGARIEVGEKKRDPMDFAVWKAAKPGEPYWDSPFGKGRPGWHIECSAMSRHYIGDTIDIHGGGADLIFPHHENEIAQSECATGQPLANIWMHNGMLNVDGAKMSKSKGNFFMVRDLSKEYGYEPIRFMLLSVHYRSQLNYTLDVIESCKAALQRLYTCRDTLNRAIEAAPEGEASAQALADVKEAQEQFIRVMDDDFNTADGISTIFELVRKINTAVSAGNATKGTLKAYNDEFTALTNVLGLLYNNNDEEQIPAEITELIEKRKEARKAKDFALADSIRDQIKALGWVVEETRQGTIVKKA